MFNIGDVIIYGAQGICKIDGFEVKKVLKDEVKYYVLKPIFNDNTAVFVPVENKNLTLKMQSVLTKSEAESLVAKIPQTELIKARDENEKRTEYKNILSSGDRERLVSLVKTIRHERNIRRESGKKLNINDEQTLRKAEILLYNELAFVYGVEPDDVKNIINF